MTFDWKSTGLRSFVALVHIIIVLCFTLPLYFGYTVTFLPSDPHIGYYSGIGDRTTLGIIWGCFATIFICVYTAQHLDVDELEEGGVQSFRLKIFYLLLGISVPEFLLFRAVDEYFDAVAITRRLQDCRDVTSRASPEHDDNSEELPLNSTRDPEAIASVDGQPFPEPRHSPVQRWTMTHSFFLMMTGFQNSDRSIITAAQLASFKENNKLKYNTISNQLDDILKEINAMSKADALVKTLACIQVTWFLVNVVARLASKLPISPLEWTTCGYIGCTLGTYAFWWHKPYNILRRITLPITIPPSDDPDINGTVTGSAISAAIGTIIFGGCHLAAWNHNFVNSSGKPLWRVCALLLTAYPIPTGTVYWIFHEYAPDSRLKNALNDQLIAVLVSVYYIARVLLICLLVLSFWSLPKGVYQDTNWSSFLPSIG